MTRRRAATTWELGSEPEIEAYIAAHSDNVSAAMRRVIKAGIKVLEHEESRLDEIVERLIQISLKIDNLSFSSLPAKDESRQVDDIEVELSHISSSVLEKLKGMAK